MKHYDDGSVYEGDWCEGIRWGNGRMWFSDGTFYDGEWENDKQCGQGLMVYGMCLSCSLFIY